MMEGTPTPTPLTPRPSLAPEPEVKSSPTIIHLPGKKQGSQVCCINIFPDVIFSAGLFPVGREPDAQEEIV